MPTLAKGDVVVLDTLGSLKETAIRSAGAHLLFSLPKLDPVEQAFGNSST